MSLTVWITTVIIACLISWLFVRSFDRRNKVEVYTPQDENQQLIKLKPYFRREVVEAKVNSLFPNQNPTAILQLLDIKVPSFYQPERVQLDILKLSEGDLEQLRHYIGVAQSDLLKVINMAEYPESSKRSIHDKDLFWGEHKREIERDFRQYLGWLKKK